MELERFSEIKRIRYTTSHPKDMTDDLIDCYKYSKKLMPLLHLPVQSGSNKILKIMNRKHNIEDYLLIYKKLKKINENIEFSSDFIIGYPGESSQDFENTLKLVNKINFINSYSFVFSARPGTPAAQKRMNNFIKSKERLKKLQNTLEKIQYKYNQNYVGKYCEVLIENKMNNQEKYFGRTKYMTPVIFEGDNCNSGELINVKINSFNRNNLFGSYKNNKVKAA